MANAFETTQIIEERFDLKGSTHGRTNPDRTGVQKDNDWTNANKRIRVGEARRKQLIRQMEEDSKFLERHQIIDYSLLVGVSKHSGNKQQGQHHVPCAISCTHTVPFFQEYDGGMLSEDGTEIYFVSIIDTLISYGIRKFAEANEPVAV